MANPPEPGLANSPPDSPQEAKYRLDGTASKHVPAISASRRMIQLDFIRGIAIPAVMEFHFNSVPVKNLLARGFETGCKRVGWMGVDPFFVLSGSWWEGCWYRSC
jgi:hypothetical protein